jgi:hypothetical protein
MTDGDRKTLNLIFFGVWANFGVLLVIAAFLGGWIG